MSKEQKVIGSTVDTLGEDEVSLSFLPSPRVQEGLERVGLRDDLMEFVTKVGDLKMLTVFLDSESKSANADNEDEVNLSFLPSPSVQEVGPREDLMEFMAKGDLKKWFKGYKVESIELNIEGAGAVKDGNLTNLFVSIEGKGGC